MEETIDFEEKSNQYEYAGFGIRLLAVFIDGLIITGLAWLIFGDDVVSTQNGFKFEMQGWQNLVTYGYYFLFWVGISSSPGKLLLGLKIIDEDGKNISAAKSLIRVLVFIIVIIGGWFILGTKDKQALHDLAAKTYVIKK